MVSTVNVCKPTKKSDDSCTLVLKNEALVEVLAHESASGLGFGLSIFVWYHQGHEKTLRPAQITHIRYLGGRPTGRDKHVLSVPVGALSSRLGAICPAALEAI